MARTQIRGNTQIKDGTIENAQIAAAAAIAYSKLDLAASITNSDVATDAAIAQSKLDLSISNSEVAADASIVESKIEFATDGHAHDGTDAAPVSYNDLSDKPSALGSFDVNREELTGADGTITDFTLASTPTSGTEHLFLNGALQNDGTDADYTITNDVVTFVDAPITGARILASYGT